MRTSEPVRIGVPTSRPNWVSFSPSSSLMRTPMMEKIVHTAKQTVKAMVDMRRARPEALSWRGLAGKVAVIVGSGLCGVGDAALHWIAKTKKPPARSSRPLIRDRVYLIGSFAW